MDQSILLDILDAGTELLDFSKTLAGPACAKPAISITLPTDTSTTIVAHNIINSVNQCVQPLHTLTTESLEAESKHCIASIADSSSKSDAISPTQSAITLSFTSNPVTATPIHTRLNLNSKPPATSSATTLPDSMLTCTDANLLNQVPVFSDSVSVLKSPRNSLGTEFSLQTNPDPLLSISDCTSIHAPTQLLENVSNEELLNPVNMQSKEDVDMADLETPKLDSFKASTGIETPPLKSSFLSDASSVTGISSTSELKGTPDVDRLAKGSTQNQPNVEHIEANPINMNTRKKAKKDLTDDQLMYRIYSKSTASDRVTRKSFGSTAISKQTGQNSHNMPSNFSTKLTGKHTSTNTVSSSLGEKSAITTRSTPTSLSNNSTLSVTVDAQVSDSDDSNMATTNNSEQSFPEQDPCTTLPAHASVNKSKHRSIENTNLGSGKRHLSRLKKTTVNKTRNVSSGTLSAKSGRVTTRLLARTRNMDKSLTAAASTSKHNNKKSDDLDSEYQQLSDLTLHHKLFEDPSPLTNPTADQALSESRSSSVPIDTPARVLSSDVTTHHNSDLFDTQTTATEKPIRNNNQRDTISSHQAFKDSISENESDKDLTDHNVLSSKRLRVRPHLRYQDVSSRTTSKLNSANGSPISGSESLSSVNFEVANNSITAITSTIDDDNQAFDAAEAQGAKASEDIVSTVNTDQTTSGLLTSEAGADIPGIVQSTPTTDNQLATSTTAILSSPVTRNSTLSGSRAASQVTYSIADSSVKDKLQAIKRSRIMNKHYHSSSAIHADHIEAAVASRLPPNEITTEEAASFPIYGNNIRLSQRYLRARNWILSIWLFNPQIFLTIENVLDTGQVFMNYNIFDKTVVSNAFKFLHRYRYINFGLMSGLPEHLVNPPVTDCRRPKIVVIGAGIAGLTAAREIINIYGESPTLSIPEIVVLEASDYVGGRIASHPLSSSRGADFPHATVDLGAQVVAGFKSGNPLDVIINSQLKLPIHHLYHSDNCHLYDIDGYQMEELPDKFAQDLFNEIFDRACSTVIIDGEKRVLNSKNLQKWQDEQRRSRRTDAPSLEKLLNHHLLSHPVYPQLGKNYLRMIHWHIAHLEFANAAPLANVSANFLNQGDGHEFTGTHALVSGGLNQVPYAYAYGASPEHFKLPILLDKKVCKVTFPVSWDGSKPQESVFSNAQTTHYGKVQCEDGSVYECDAVVMALPLGVIKANTIQFEPPLPTWKQESIDALGMGILNKIILVFPNRFWDEHMDLFGALVDPSSPVWPPHSSMNQTKNDINSDEYSDVRGQCFMFWNLYQTTKLPVLSAFVSGQAALDMAMHTDEELVNGAVKVLMRIFANVSPFPQPIEYFVTRWEDQPNIKGSYSFIGKNATNMDYDRLAETCFERMFWAGEATCKDYPATVPGAIISGFRAATQVTNLFMGQTRFPEIPNPQGFKLTKFGSQSNGCHYSDCHISIPATISLFDHIYETHLIHRQKLLRKSKQAPKSRALSYTIGDDGFDVFCEEHLANALALCQKYPNMSSNDVVKMWWDGLVSADRRTYMEAAAARNTLAESSHSEHTPLASSTLQESIPLVEATGTSENYSNNMDTLHMRHSPPASSVKRTIDADQIEKSLAGQDASTPMPLSNNDTFVSSLPILDGHHNQHLIPVYRPDTTLLHERPAIPRDELDTQSIQYINSRPTTYNQNEPLSKHASRISSAQPNDMIPTLERINPDGAANLDFPMKVLKRKADHAELYLPRSLHSNKPFRPLSSSGSLYGSDVDSHRHAKMHNYEQIPHVGPMYPHALDQHADVHLNEYKYAGGYHGHESTNSDASLNPYFQPKREPVYIHEDNTRMRPRYSSVEPGPAPYAFNYHPTQALHYTNQFPNEYMRVRSQKQPLLSGTDPYRHELPVHDNRLFSSNSYTPSDMSLISEQPSHHHASGSTHSGYMQQHTNTLHTKPNPSLQAYYDPSSPSGFSHRQPQEYYDQPIQDAAGGFYDYPLRRRPGRYQHENEHAPTPYAPPRHPAELRDGTPSRQGEHGHQMYYPQLNHHHSWQETPPPGSLKPPLQRTQEFRSIGSVFSPSKQQSRAHVLPLYNTHEDASIHPTRSSQGSIDEQQSLKDTSEWMMDKQYPGMRQLGSIPLIPLVPPPQNHSPSQIGERYYQPTQQGYLQETYPYREYSQEDRNSNANEIGSPQPGTPHGYLQRRVSSEFKEYQYGMNTHNRK
ncbi:hypothetical protein QVD99_007092 [Batrachochytrium dendrobatidis]|nr:hypothetical protein QVD99_007092 [Batrachochytrium dendrobatidis]